ncbi:AAA family ATPase [Acinetobacter soli]
MISSFTITGFKSIANQEIEFSSLTLLAGLNNSGKSSVIQSLRMYSAANNGDSALLGGHGSISDLRSDFVNVNENIIFKMKFQNSLESFLELNNHEILTKPITCPVFFYVGADRLGPQPFLPLNVALNSRPKVGDRGEFVIDFVKKLEESGYLIPDKMLHPASEGKTFEFALQGWLTEISPGVKFTFSTNRKADISHAEIDNYRPANVGFGLSYTLPIIAATLGATAKAPNTSNLEEWLLDWEQHKNTNGVLLVLENPEAHLHPQGQTAMGRLLAYAASCGVQIVVETHSEHVMDGIRIAVKDGLLKSDNVKFHYLSKSKGGQTIVQTPVLDSDGKLDFWPDGFFDQTLKNRSKLAKRSR